MSSVRGREDASTIFKVVSIVASSAVSIVSTGSALIRNRHADIVIVEDPVSGAGEADLIVPVPGSAAEVGGSSVV